MATRIVVEKESAIGEREKRTLDTQEIIRTATKTSTSMKLIKHLKTI